jgi:hypothetical protein
MAVFDDATAQGKFRAFAASMRNLKNEDADTGVAAIILSR